jgi:hypothetical protein
MSNAIVKALLPALMAFGLGVAPARAEVDPALLALVQPEAKMLIGIQVIQAQASPLGQYLLSQVQLDQSANKVMTAANFDPRRDLREILAASGDNLAGLLLGRGSFQPAKISKAAVAAGAVSSTYRGVEILSINGTGKINAAGSLAFLDASTVAAGDPDAVKAVIDRRAAGANRPAAGQAKGAVLSVELAERARQISEANDAWVATLTPPTAFSSGAQSFQLGPFQGILQSAQQLSAGLKFTTTQVTLSAEVLTRTAQEAQSMADLLKFVAGMIQSAAQDPKAPNTSPNTPKTPALANAVQVSSSGPVMHLVISIPEQQMEQLLLPDSKKPNSKRPDSKQPASGQPKKIA